MRIIKKHICIFNTESHGVLVNFPCLEYRSRRGEMKGWMWAQV